MNVLLLTHRLPFAPNRGDRIRAYYLLEALTREANVDLVSLVHDRDEASQVHLLQGRVRSVTMARVGRARSWLRAVAALGTGQPLTHALLDAPGFDRALADVTAEHRPDVVVALCSSMARFVLRPPLDELPLILDLIDVDSEKWRQMGASSRGPLGWIYRREARVLGPFESFASRRAAATLVVNDRERTALEAIAPDAPVHVVPNGIDALRFTPPASPSVEAQVVFCGVMDYAPNVDGVLWFVKHVWPRVRQANANARLTLVGARPTPAIRALSSDSSIEVTGTVPDVRPYLWRSAVSIAPLLIARGVQNKVLEALAAGLPCVVSAPVFEGVPRAARPGCIEGETPSAFAASVIRLLSMRPQERRRLASQVNLSELSWREAFAPLGGLLHTVAGQPGPRFANGGALFRECRA
ncbi:MAG: TIGR03087 family PEP-CTERM/XrtA system glycosyltransferase [Acidobacteria bacterium]|nr:MAG: TIGR03087 family PEP-CTERM/XrtA system glycosyltransferase [Acidobacteriota bacterium]